MTEKKECVHCRRSIDAMARVCPYCNREQALARAAEPRAAVPLPPIENAPPPRTPSRKLLGQWSTPALLVAAVVALLMASFAVGGLVYGLGRRGEKSAPENDQPPQTADNVSRAEREFPQLTLVPEADPTTTIGRSITSAPIPDPDHKLPAEFQRSDATALPSAEYAKIMEQSRNRAPAPPQPASIDPRSVPAQSPSATIPQQPMPARRTEEPAERPAPRESEASREPAREAEPLEPRRERTVRTNPVPLYQPLPRIKDREEEIQESGTLRFRLNVGRDGLVKEIRVLETMPGMTGKMIAAIQKWKFKPATENGVPVDGTFMVDISFKAPE